MTVSPRTDTAKASLRPYRPNHLQRLEAFLDLRQAFLESVLLLHQKLAGVDRCRGVARGVPSGSMPERASAFPEARASAGAMSFPGLRVAMYVLRLI